MWGDFGCLDTSWSRENVIIGELHLGGWDGGVGGEIKSLDVFKRKNKILNRYWVLDKH